MSVCLDLYSSLVIHWVTLNIYLIFVASRLCQSFTIWILSHAFLWCMRNGCISWSLIYISLFDYMCWSMELLHLFFMMLSVLFSSYPLLIQKWSLCVSHFVPPLLYRYQICNSFGISMRLPHFLVISSANHIFIFRNFSFISSILYLTEFCIQMYYNILRLRGLMTENISFLFLRRRLFIIILHSELLNISFLFLRRSLFIILLHSELLQSPKYSHILEILPEFSHTSYFCQVFFCLTIVWDASYSTKSYIIFRLKYFQS